MKKSEEMERQEGYMSIKERLLETLKEATTDLTDAVKDVDREQFLLFGDLDSGKKKSKKKEQWEYFYPKLREE